MRYVIREKLLCLGDDFRIQDAAGRDVFFVDGRAFNLLREKLSFQDVDGKELAFIREKLIALRKTYEIYREGKRVAAVRKDLFDFFSCQFTVDVPGPNDYRAKGNFLQHHYVFERGGRIVAEVSKRWLTVRDTYGVDIQEGEDDLLILASAVVIDQICHDGKDHS